MASQKYKDYILEFSLLLNHLQKPIQVLDAVKLGDEVENFIIEHKFQKLPKIDYNQRPLKYDPQKKLEELKEFKLKVIRDIGETDPLGIILRRNASQYEDVVSMLMARGTREFHQFSKKLYGSTNEIMGDGKTKLCDLANILDGLLSNLEGMSMGESFKRTMTSVEVVEELKGRLEKYFAGEKIKIKLSDGIVSDASAGSDYIKIKNNLMFAKRDVDIFEVHEGWVHLGTTINGQKQTYAKWLAKGPPCSTVTQEGLAVIMELFNFALFPKRAKRLNDRLVVCQMAESGANFLDIIHYFREKGQEDRQAIKNASRIFRGTHFEGGAPFTKDISYLKGFVMIYNFLRTSVKENKTDLIPFLFAGKVTLEEIPTLKEFSDEGVIDFPHYLPPQFKDLNGLGIWMAFSNFFNRMRLEDVILENKKEEKTGMFKKIA